MDVAIIGAGRLAKAIREQCVARGATATLHSRSTGFDVLDPEPADRLGAPHVVVEATDIFTQNANRAKQFFSRSTRAANTVARAHGARHVLVSIVGCTRPELQGNGYYAGKAEQERIALAEHERLTIVRSTQWHEFARQNLDRMRLGPLAVVPSMTVQPVALASVADVVARCVTGQRPEGIHDVAGPEVTTLWEMTKALPDKGALPVALPLPGRTGKAFRHGALLPGPDAEILGPTFGEWLTAGA